MVVFDIKFDITLAAREPSLASNDDCNIQMYMLYIYHATHSYSINMHSFCPSQYRGQ